MHTNKHKPLTGERIFLRAPEPEDLDWLYGIENNSELWSVGSVNAPYSRFALKEYIAACSNDIFETKQMRFVISTKDGQENIGLIDIFNFSALDSRAEVGIALLSEHQGKGYAGEALELLEQYAQNHLRLRLLYAKMSPARHERSLKLFLANGYVRHATLPAWHFFDGKFEDVAVVCKFFSK